VSPSIGCPAKASPSAVQSWRVPVSKSRLSGRPSGPTGRTPAGFGTESAPRARVPNKKKSPAERSSRRIALPPDERQKKQVLYCGEHGGLVNWPRDTLGSELLNRQRRTLAS